MNISPLFIAIFTFSFALTLGVLWEIFEFSGDALFHMNMQRWSAPPGTPLLGQEYQGNGLRDTMSDLIVDAIGALIAAVAAFYWYKADRQRVLNVMRSAFPGVAKNEKK